MAATQRSVRTMKAITLDPDYKARQILHRFLTVLPGVQPTGSMGQPWEILSLARHVEPDVLFIDLSVVTGERYCAWIRELSRRREVVITSYFDDPVLDELRGYISDHLFKPVDFEELNQLINRLNLK